MADSLLIIEDEKLLGTELARHFRNQGSEVGLAGNLDEARRRLFDGGDESLVVLADMTLPDGSSLDLLESTRDAGLPGQWILLTGYGSVPSSVRALRLGTFDFLEKPCAAERLTTVVNGARRSAQAHRRLRAQADAGSRRYGPSAFIGRSRAAGEVRELIARLTRVSFSALIICGATGTGKGLVACILHYSGLRAAGPLIEVNSEGQRSGGHDHHLGSIAASHGATATGGGFPGSFGTSFVVSLEHG